MVPITLALVHPECEGIKQIEIAGSSLTNACHGATCSNAFIQAEGKAKPGDSGGPLFLTNHGSAASYVGIIKAGNEGGSADYVIASSLTVSGASGTAVKR